MLFKKVEEIRKHIELDTVYLRRSSLEKDVYVGSSVLVKKKHLNSPGFQCKNKG